MDILTQLKGLWYVGFRPLAEAALYTIRRSLIERATKRSWTPFAGDPPGRIKTSAARNNGISFAFDKAELEIVFLAPDLVRITWQPGVLPVPYALAEQGWGEVAVSVDENDSGWTLGAGDVTVAVSKDGAIRTLGRDGAVLRDDLPPLLAHDAWTHRARSHRNEQYIGLGERTSPLNLAGGEFRMWNNEPKGHYGPGDDPIYICMPVYVGHHESGNYLIFFENSFDARFEFGDEVHASFSGGALRYYVAAGSLKQLSARFSELTGRPPLPPRWSLGYHQARWSYRTETEVRELVAGFEKHNLPLSVVHLDIHYMDGYRIFTVDRERFPDMAGLTSDLADKGIRTVMILDPGVKQDHKDSLFWQGVEKDAFCELADGKPAVAPVWPGACRFPDFTKPSVREWWGDQYRHFVDWGVSGVWHDMNEPAAFTAWGDTSLPSATRHDMEGRGGEHLEAHNLYALLENRAGFEALRRLRPDARPWLLTRSGWVGLQRYCWTWTGDSESNWWGVKQTIRIALSLGLCGVPYSGPDIGGFGGVPTEELLIRWFQLATFLPLFRMHSAVFVPRREPWSYGARALDIFRDFLTLRYRLLPYWYTLAWEASQTGHPLVRPLFWEEDAGEAQWDVDDAFTLGSALLVAPIVVEGARDRVVPLPAGQWYSYWDDELISGPASYRSRAPLDRIPLFVRAGSVLPMEEDGQLVLHVYALTAESNDADRHRLSELYSDVGDGYGPWRVDRFEQERAGDSVTITRTGEGELEWPHSDAQLVVHGTAVAQVICDGDPVDGDQGRYAVGLFDQVEVTEGRDP